MESQFYRKIVVFSLSFLLILMTINLRVVQAQSFFTWGHYGDTVRTIQTKLQRWGYYNGPVDGVFGYKTYEAVVYFQKSNGLKADGIAGTKTLEALGIFLTTAASTKSPGPATQTPATKPTDLPTQTPQPTAISEEMPVDGKSSRENDIWLLAKVINGEGRGESYLGQVAIGSVVLNRVKHPSFPNTISGVIYQAGAFDAVRDGQFDLTPSESCVNAARDAMNGWDPVEGAVFYWNPNTATNKWILSLTVIKTIGNHAFAVN